MEPARPGITRRRPRRGSPERPIDSRLVRKTSLLLVVPLLLAALTVARPGPLPAPTLPPAFDGATALALTRELTRDFPARVPGSPEADRAASWLTERLALYGLATEQDDWTADIPGLGTTRLRNLQAVVEGTLDEAIVLVAHRDNSGGTAGANDNASGTAALVEIARGYATLGTGGAEPRRPLHTLVFLSTDGGAYGALGAARFATSSPFRGRVAAVVSLDGLAGRPRTRLEVAGLGARSPAPALVRTISVRAAAQLGRAPAQPDLVRQLVSLGLPFGYGEQAALLRAGMPALRLTTASDTGPVPGTDELETLDAGRLTRLGAAAETTLGSLDAAVELPRSTAAVLYLGDRGVRGWAVALVLVVAVLPFGAATVDLLGRARRRGLHLAGAVRALRRRVGLWLVLVGLVAVAGIAGGLPRGGALPPPPDQPPLDAWPPALVVVLVAGGTLAWLRSRALLLPRRPPDEDEVIAAFCVVFVALVGVALATALVNPYALVFLLPSLYAWLWLPHLRHRRGGLGDLAFGAGLVGPLFALVVLSEQLELGVRAPLYALALVTSGVVPWPATLALAVWAACAAQVGALVAGRYTPVPPSRRR